MTCELVIRSYWGHTWLIKYESIKSAVYKNNRLTRAYTKYNSNSEIKNMKFTEQFKKYNNKQTSGNISRSRGHRARTGSTVVSVAATSSFCPAASAVVRRQLRMHSSVSLPLVAARESTTTHVASERLFTCMSSQVCRQVVAATQRARTYRTLERLLSGVDTHVTHQLIATRETTSALVDGTDVLAIGGYSSRCGYWCGKLLMQMVESR